MQRKIVIMAVLVAVLAFGASWRRVFVIADVVDCLKGPAVKCIRWLPSCGGKLCHKYDLDGDYDVDLYDWSLLID